ncbi:MAG TPA: C25 family cysteine peptidase [Bacteroidales bacterium]|nr:C25 family cysteine peptidase [Bacteroidales bacterium]
MNKIQKLLVLVAVLILANGTIIAQKNVTLLENSADQIRVSFATSSISTINVKTDQGFFSRVLMDEYQHSSKVGYPELPEMVQLIEVPISDQIQIRVIPGSYEDYPASALGVEHPLYPAQPSYSKSESGPFPLVKNDTVYTTNQFYGMESLASVEQIGIMRNVNLARVVASPVLYNPVTNTYRVYKTIEIIVTFVNPNIAETNRIKTLHSSPLFNVAQSKVLNPTTFGIHSELNHTPIKMVIVSDPMFAEQLSPFVNWKRRKGFIVDLALTSDAGVGTSTTSIKEYIKAHYTNATPTNPAPTFVLFVGDVAQIPAFNGTSGSHVTDLYYVTFTTGDNLPDCYYGRFSATNSSQLSSQIEKSLMYEQYTMQDPSYLDAAVLVAGTDASFGPTHANGQISYLANNYINATYGYTTVNTHMYPASSQAALIRQEIGAGVGYANYTAHCGSTGWSDPSFENNHVPNMVNEDKYGLMIGNCCQSGKFNDAECFGEAVLRASKKGAVAYIGASNNSYWNEDYYWAVGLRSTINASPTYQASNLGAYDRLFHTHNESQDKWMVTNQAICQAGNLAVETSTSTLKLYYWEIYHLFGDPSMMTYLTQAETMTVSSPQALMVGANSMTVNCAPFAYVSLNKDGVILGATFADGSGVAQLTFDPISEPGEYELAAWAQNYKQHFSIINVIVPSGSYVLASSAVVTPGDIPYFNATVGLDITFSNVGVADANNVYATISTNTPYITLLTDSIYIGSIVQGANQVSPGAFSLQVAHQFPNQTQVQVLVSIHSDNNTSQKIVPITLLAPELIFENSSMSDFSSNNNGVIEPGETITVTISNKNIGQGTLYQLTSRLNSFYSGAEVVNGVQYHESIASGESVASTFTVHIDTSVTEGSIIPLYHTFYRGSYLVNETVFIVVGSTMEDFESGDFTIYPWVNSSNAWTIVNSNVYAGTYSAKSKTNLSNSSSSTLQITLNALSDGNISYYRKVSSEYGYDFFKFYIDGQEKESLSGTSSSWGVASFPVTAGTHTYKFEYKKDVSQATGSDCAWIDNIVFPPFGTATADDIARLVVDSHEFTVNGTVVDVIPFETPALVTFHVRNPSAITAQNIEANLSTDHSSIAINNGTQTLPSNMLQNDIQTVTFPIQSTQIRNQHSNNVDFTMVLSYQGVVVDYPLSARFEGIPSGVCEIYELNCMIFPIPATTSLTVESVQEIDHIFIYDINGKQINFLSSVGSNKSMVSVSGLASGVYFIKVVGVDQKIAIKKFIKK